LIQNARGSPSRSAPADREGAESDRQRRREHDRRTGQSAKSSPFDSLAALMPDVFWIGFGLATFIFLVGVVSGARSSTTSLRAGAAIGAYLGVMLAFPLLAIGLATS
jgi:hypothetical protein